jgi:hypothetical protein
LISNDSVPTYNLNSLPPNVSVASINFINRKGDNEETTITTIFKTRGASTIFTKDAIQDMKYFMGNLTDHWLWP